MSFIKLAVASSLAAALFCLSPVVAMAQSVTPAPGWIYSRLLLSDELQSCVQAGPGMTFVGLGPGLFPAFNGGGQAVVRVSESGGESVVASGFNSIADCAYDRASDTLYVTDNALEASGALSGDTVFAVASASSAVGLTAVGSELAPAGAIANAASVVVSASGDVLVGDAAGGGVGSVQRVAAGTVSPFVGSGLDFTGGLALADNGDLLVAESLASFANQIGRYDASGAFVGLVVTPTFSVGSFDMDFARDGRLLVSGLFGGDVVSVDDADGSFFSLASGFNFATGLDVDPFSGRVQLLSSTFSGADEDFSLHRLTPVSRLVAGGGSPKSDCVAEFYGLELVAKKPGKPAKKAICVDGAACDADGQENDECLFPLGFCLAVDDARLAACSAAGVASFALKKVKPLSAEVTAAAAAVAGLLPLASPACVFSDGIRVPLKITASGKKKPGKGLVKIKVASADAKPLKDIDKAKLVCLPAGP